MCTSRHTFCLSVNSFLLERPARSSYHFIACNVTTLYLDLGELNSTSSSGGASRKSPSWISTGRKITLKDGSKRTLYKNMSIPGDHRIRRMTLRAGKISASYVKP